MGNAANFQRSKGKEDVKPQAAAIQQPTDVKVKPLAEGMAERKVPLISVNCCDPVCCVHKSQRQNMNESDFLIRTFMRREQNQDKIDLSPENFAKLMQVKKADQKYEFPVKGDLDLTKEQLKSVGTYWDHIQNKEAFVSSYLSKLFEMPEARRPFMLPQDTPEGRKMEDLGIFKRHIFLQTLSYDTLVDNIDSEDGLKRFAQELGMRHLKFRRTVVFEPWLWTHVIDCFMRTLDERGNCNDEVKSCWKRLLSWFFSRIDRTFKQRGADMLYA